MPVLWLYGVQQRVELGAAPLTCSITLRLLGIVVEREVGWWSCGHFSVLLIILVAISMLNVHVGATVTLANQQLVTSLPVHVRVDMSHDALVARYVGGQRLK